ncbi:MAG TPA: hypothetical protein DCF68_23100 [Cyanothece sp. UBA12306]|nr:hypothetical protein [Cyanothece sp. UBA12306]
MTISTSENLKSLYKEDYNLWLETTVKQLELGQFYAIDWENLIEEITQYCSVKLKTLVVTAGEHRSTGAGEKTENHSPCSVLRSPLLTVLKVKILNRAVLSGSLVFEFIKIVFLVV